MTNAADDFDPHAAARMFGCVLWVLAALVVAVVLLFLL